MSKFLPFDEALAVARSLGLASRTSGRCGARKGCGLPTCPPTQTRPTRTAGGRGGATGSAPATSTRKQFLPFDEALAVAQSLGLASQKEWKAWCKEGMRPPNVPSHPDRTYKDGGWQGWGHWLGTGNQQAGKAVPAV